MNRIGFWLPRSVRRGSVLVTGSVPASFLSILQILQSCQNAQKGQAGAAVFQPPAQPPRRVSHTFRTLFRPNLW